jgi:hypothetical protein
LNIDEVKKINLEKSELIRPVPTLRDDGKLTIEAVHSKLSEEPTSWQL